MTSHVVYKLTGLSSSRGRSDRTCSQIVCSNVSKVNYFFGRHCFLKGHTTIVMFLLTSDGSGLAPDHLKFTPAVNITHIQQMRFIGTPIRVGHAGICCDQTYDVLPLGLYKSRSVALE